MLPIGGTIFPQQSPLWDVLLGAQIDGAAPLDGH